jgi:tRNA A-37 threonylcarbamoyl transferase component Bud32
MGAAVDHTPQLEKYELIEEVGHGGMASVYRARDRRLDREVAVKLIHRHLRENREVAARFVAEARAVARLKHPNIVEVYDVSGDEEVERYLVVELVRGPSLRELLVQHGHLPPELAACIGVEVCSGLEQAHLAGIIHRDVKPENVLLAPAPRSGREVSRPRATETPEGAVKLTDFGIAKLLDSQGVTSTGQVLGSPAHMSPEQIEGGEVTVRSDVFGVGVLLYECLVGKLPFDGNNPAQVLRRVLDGHVAAAERCRPTVGLCLARIAHKALAHVSEERYSSVVELRDALLRELADMGMDAPSHEVGAFLADSSGYLAAFEERIVARLVEAARRARGEGDVARAAALFNRALAYRPDDAELLAEVTRLVRGARLRRLVGGAVGVVLVVGAIGAGGYWGYRALWPQASHSPSSGEGSAAGVTNTEGGVVVEAVAESLESLGADANPPGGSGAAPSAQGRPQRPEAPRVVRPAASAAPVAAPLSTRQVRFHISGAAGGKLRIDGQPQEWFGVIHELTIGAHRVEFMPPNPDCCVSPPPTTINVAPGPDAQQVHGHISFRDATLRFSGPAGAILRCGELFAGELLAGAERAVPLSRPSLTVRCTQVPPSGSTVQPKSIDVTLRPGGTITVTGP